MRNSKAIIVLGVLASLLFAAFFLNGCEQYGEVSDESYEYAKVLYGVCRRREDRRSPSRAEALQKVRDQLAASFEAGEVSEKENDWLMDIITTAESGDVKTAAAKARAMLDEQVHP